MAARSARPPNLDRVAEAGTVFEQAYCPYPLCAPSRFAMMSGRLASRIGAWDNGSEFPASVPTFAHYLRLRGYYTCISGKMHFVGPDQLHGFEERLTTEIYPADFSWTPEPEERDAENRFGAGVSSVETILDAGPMARTMQIDYDEDVIHHAVREVYVRARSADTRPFMMTVSLTQPHDPYVTTREWWDLYEGIDIDPPVVDPIPLDARDPHSRMLHAHYGQDRTPIDAGATDRARRAYYGMISHVDAMFGRLLDALSEAGMAENTIVIFALRPRRHDRRAWHVVQEDPVSNPRSGCHSSCADPASPRGRVTTPVSLLDLFPTLVEFSGAARDMIRTPLDGRSLAPLLDGGSRDGPVLAEHLDGGTDAPRVMLRDGDLKLVLSRAYPPLLHDLGNDPLELADLAREPSARADLERLTARAEETWNLDALCRGRSGPARRQGRS